MPTFVSVQGNWKPAKEEVALRNNTEKEIVINGKTVGAGRPYIYEGPDRAALYLLWEQSGKPTDPKNAMTSLGTHFKKDPEFIARVRQMGFNNVDEYLTAYGYNEKEELERMSKLASEVKSHEVVKRAKEIDMGTHGGVEQGSGKVLVSGAIGDVPMPI